MGLDMYLSKTKYYGRYVNENERPQISGFNECDSITVSGVVIYWRKANAIHQWFVEHVQDNNDDCGTYYVDRDQLKELLEAVKEVLSSRTKKGMEQGIKAEDILPTKSGFFFGSTDYDEWYWDDMKQTKKELEALINNPDFEKYDYQYHSSW